MNYNILSELTLRRISSSEFIIKTKAIHELEEQVLLWLSTSSCGAIIYGRARIGKTRAMMSVTEGIKEVYGAEFPVIAWDITDHAITEKNFYTSLLMAMGLCNISPRQTALALKERVLNELVIAAYKTPYKKVVIMLDEAWKFSEKDFSWLMDLYNILNRKDILLTCFLFGTRELKDFKSEFKVQGKDQIVGRFMINEFQFKGMKEPEEIMLCLIAFDKMTVTIPDKNSAVLLRDYYFPMNEGSTFVGLSKDYWAAFMQIKEKYGICTDDIPMKYFIDSFIFLLRKYGNFSKNSIVFPTYEELLNCIEESGYGESDDEYELSKTRTSARKRRQG